MWCRDQYLYDSDGVERNGLIEKVTFEQNFEEMRVFPTGYLETGMQDQMHEA